MFIAIILNVPATNAALVVYVYETICVDVCVAVGEYGEFPNVENMYGWSGNAAFVDISA